MTAMWIVVSGMATGYSAGRTAMRGVGKRDKELCCPP
jgi:hypothetical protein